jgi:NodT family efflux transporter outer membrane factor (OMF) lipoprotein
VRSSRAILLLLVTALSACAAGPGYRAPKPDMPPAFASQVPSSAATFELSRWWRALNDVELDSLVDRAVKSNLDIAIALDRLQQARTYEVAIAGVALPVVDATGAAGRGTGSDLTRGRADQGLVSADNSNGLTHINTLAGFDALWELDLFGKYRREFQAARAGSEAAQAARLDVLTAVIADVVRSYVDLRGLQMRASIVHKASEVLRESLRIVNLRFQRGITNELDVALARRELATLDAQIAPLEAQVNAAQYSLAVLVGEYPESMVQELSRPDLIPAMPAPIGAGAPLDLLKRRPDIRQAERELAVATAHIGVATANLFPQIALVGSIGSQGQGWGTTPRIAEHVWSFGPGALWPLLDFGALDAEVDIAGLDAQASLAHYRKILLSAVQQVDTSLDAYQAQRERLERLGEAMTAGQRAVDLATERYNRGLTDYLNVIDAEREFYALEDQYAEAQVVEGEQFVALYRSLGGGWEDYQAVPAIRRPQPAIIAAFRRTLSSAIP